MQTETYPAAETERVFNEIAANPENHPVFTADDIEVLAEARNQARAEALAILAQREEDYAGKNKPQNHPMDRGGSARRLISNPDSQTADDNFMDDVRFGVWEAFSNMKCAIFPVVEGVYDPDSEDILVNGEPQLASRRAALAPGLSEEMRGRAINEYVEIKTITEMAKQGLIDFEVYTTSRCGFAEDGGFNQDLQKCMDRRVWFEIDESGRIHYFTQTVTTVGLELDDRTTAQCLIEEGVLDSEVTSIDPTDTLGLQRIVPRGKYQDLLDYVQWRDRKLGSNVALGIREESWERADYEEFRQGSIRWQQELESSMPEIAETILSTVALGLETDVTNELIRVAIAKHVDELCRKDPDLAEGAFGRGRSQDYQKYLNLVADGSSGQAQALKLELTKKAVEETNICTAGSCGLRQATPREAEQAREAGLKGEVMAFENGFCPDCGHKGYLVTDLGEKLCVNNSCHSQDA